MRMTGNGWKKRGEQEGEREKKILHSWQKQHGRITQLFFIHTPLHSHMISKVPKPQGSLPANTVCQFFKPVTPFRCISSCCTKGLLLALSQLLLSLCLCKVNTWGGVVHSPPPQCITLRSHCKATNIIVGVFFSPACPCILTAHNVTYFGKKKKNNHMSAWEYGLCKYAVMAWAIHKKRVWKMYRSPCQFHNGSLKWNRLAGNPHHFFSPSTVFSKSQLSLYLLDVNKNCWASDTLLPTVKYMRSCKTRPGRCRQTGG